MASKLDQKVAIAPYEATPLESIPAICKTVRDTFSGHKTKQIEWRKVQLRKLYWAIVDYTKPLLEALHRDLGKSEYEAILTEIDFVKTECMFMLKHIDDFAKDKSMTSLDVPMHFSMARFRFRKEPIGAVLIIGAYNMPFMLSISPAVGAIAAGCPAVIKPSELAPHTAAVLKEMFEARMDSSAYIIVNGHVPETTALLDEKWDKIFYTGSAAVGKIISQKAAETLTPVTLELGGRNPTFITKNTNIKLAARRALWGKTLNAGQICISANYIMVEKEVVESFIKELGNAYEQFFPNGSDKSGLSRIVNERHFLRMKQMLSDSKGKVVLGGKMDQTTLFMEPTAVLVDSVDDAMIQQETFGPTFSILPVSSLSEAITIANMVDRTPLGLYCFGNDAENERVLNEVTSGGATLNDTYFHGSVTSVAFGGVGTSGSGSYRGKSSFDTFTHVRSVANPPQWMEKLLRVRYMPYDLASLRPLAMLAPKPNFDREGRVTKGLGYWVGLVLRLGGGGGVKGALFRWCLVLTAGYVSKFGLTMPSRA